MKRLQVMRNFDVGYYDIYSIFADIMQAHFASIKEKREQNSSEIYLEFALRYIHHNYAGELRVSLLTEQIGISQPHLYNIFQTYLGVSPKEYIDNFRAEEAVKLLLESDLTVSEVGRAVGYHDPMSFSRFFSAQKGIAPSRFREKYQITFLNN